jgi:thiamine-phosphate pyrophosphorylase
MIIYNRLQYISQGQTSTEQLHNIKEVLDAGCRWVQLRFKNADAKQLTLLAEQVKERCLAYKAVLIINDHPEIAHAIEADGVHLGLKDISVQEARTLLGSKKIIGGTANTLNDVAMRLQEDCNYIGLGPYRYTSTKNSLSPVLGIEGYHNILSELQKLNVGIPVYAIGGIEPSDIPLLLEAGIYGVAVSGALTNKPDTKDIIQHINSNLYATA